MNVFSQFGPQHFSFGMVLAIDQASFGYLDCLVDKILLVYEDGPLVHLHVSSLL